MKNFVYVLIVVLVIGLGILYFMKSSPTEPTPGEQTTNETETSVSSVSVKSVSNGAAPLLAGAKVITWETAGYPAGAGININLLRKTSDSPQTFESVRAIATDTANDGEETWTPLSGENLSNLYIEVTCSNTFMYYAGCQVSGQAIPVSQ